MITPTETDRGRWVTYIAHDGHREAGLLSSWNDKVAFVKYHRGDTAAATLLDQLEWGIVGKVTNRLTGEWTIA